MIDLNQLWADEMNGKVERGTYRKELLKQYPPPTEDEKMDKLEQEYDIYPHPNMHGNLICYTEKMQFEARIKELEAKLAEIKKPKTDEEVMKLWDTWREYIAKGGTASWPRDGFESVISWYEERIEELEERIQLAEATREDALAYAKMYKEKIKELESERDSETRWARQYFDQWEQAQTRIKELEGERDRLQFTFNEMLNVASDQTEAYRGEQKKVKELVEGIEIWIRSYPLVSIDELKKLIEGYRYDQ